MKIKAALTILLLCCIAPLYSDDTTDEFGIELNPLFTQKKGKTINIAPYKKEMTDGLQSRDDLFDMTLEFYNDPEKTDLFLEAHLNGVDFPDCDPAIKIDIDEQKYNQNKLLYKTIREKKFILSSTTVKFSQYAQSGEYPTGGLLYRKDYNRSTGEFFKRFNESDVWSRYHWRLKGMEHLCTMVFIDGTIRINVPGKDARILTGLFRIMKPQKATFMGMFRIKEKRRDYMLIEPVRYMIIWRKKGKVYTNFTAPLDGKPRDDEDMTDKDENNDDDSDEE